MGRNYAWQFEEEPENRERRGHIDRHKRSDPLKRQSPYIDGRHWLPLSSEADVMANLGAWATVQRWGKGPGWVVKGQDIPMAKYYNIQLGKKSREIVRECLYDLFDEGVVISAFTHPTMGNFLNEWQPLYEAVKVWATEQITIKQVAQVLGIDYSLAKVRVEAGTNIAITRMRPKALRDQIIRAVLGERLPKFTREEVARLIAEEKSMGR